MNHPSFETLTQKALFCGLAVTAPGVSGFHPVICKANKAQWLLQATQRNARRVSISGASFRLNKRQTSVLTRRPVVALPARAVCIGGSYE